MKQSLIGASLVVLACSSAAVAQEVRVVDCGGGIYQAVGVGVAAGATVRVPQSNTFLIVTSGGNVVVDTSLAAVAPAHKAALTAVNPGHVRAIILTHARRPHRWNRDVAAGGHPDHRAPQLSRVPGIHQPPRRVLRAGQRGAIRRRRGRWSARRGARADGRRHCAALGPVR